ncbi:ribosome biogenesis GTPase Der [Breznakiellaceae bacterium SP9]
MQYSPGPKYTNLPVVVLVGKPNVGKSTLFNRLLHKRRAITDPTPGVTRDPIAATAFLMEKPVCLVDTGGFKLDREDNDTIDDLVLAKTLQTLETADCIVFIMEPGNLSTEDEEFIAFLRPYQERVIAVVNKTEGGRLEAQSYNVLRYGFATILMISAEHGDRIPELANAICERLDFSRVRLDDGCSTKPICLALLGKPNTGKSTLSNRLTQSAASLVSPVPGTTRDVIEGQFTYKNRTFQVLDTAGIRRKARVTENIEYYSVNRAIKAIDNADVVLLLIDAQEGLSDQDKKIASLANDRGRGIILVLNKWDTQPDTKKAVKDAAERITYFFGQMEYAPIVNISGLDGSGIDTLLNTSIRMAAQLERQIETAPLNHALEAWLTEHPPPAGPKTRFKIKYAVQTSVNPVKFLFFASRPAAVTQSYISYIRNRLRKDLGFSLIPLLIEIRPSGKERKERC